MAFLWRGWRRGDKGGGLGTESFEGRLREWVLAYPWGASGQGTPAHKGS